MTFFVPWAKQAQPPGERTRKKIPRGVLSSPLLALRSFAPAAPPALRGPLRPGPRDGTLIPPSLHRPDAFTPLHQKSFSSSGRYRSNSPTSLHTHVAVMTPPGVSSTDVNPPSILPPAPTTSRDFGSPSTVASAVIISYTLANPG